MRYSFVAPTVLAAAALALTPQLVPAQNGGADSTNAKAGGAPATQAETITFTPGMRIQGRYAYDAIDDNNDFYIARVRLKAKGDVYRLATYYAEIKLDNVGRFAATVNAQIENAWLNFPVVPALQVRIGLYDAVFSRNALTSDSKLLLIDRSLIKDDLTAIGLADNTVGVLVHGRPGKGRFEYGAGVFDNLQFDQGATPSGSPPPRQADGAMVMGRVAVHLLDPAPVGGYADYQSSYIGQGRRLSIGLNAAQLSKASAGDKFDIRAWGADLFFNLRALTVEAEYDTFIEDKELNLDIDGDGWFTQAGYLVLPRIELAARYQELDRDDPTGAFQNTYQWTSVGVNYYIRGHGLKVQADYTFKKERINPVGNNVLQAQLQMDF